jgi:hypothetical protein
MSGLPGAIFKFFGISKSGDRRDVFATGILKPNEVFKVTRRKLIATIDAVDADF